MKRYRLRERGALTASVAALLPMLVHPADSVFAQTDGRAVAIEFSDTPVARTEEAMLRTHTRSVARVTFADGRRRDFPLSYVSLFRNTDPIADVGGRKFAAGQVFDHTMAPVHDPNGDPVISEAPDANSLLNVGGRLVLVNHWEYDALLTTGQPPAARKQWYKRMPMGMSLTEIVQGPDGRLGAARQKPIDFSTVGGGWNFCFGSQTPWNTHLGGEEDYDLFFVPGEQQYRRTVAGLKAMTEVYFRGTRNANPYHYGYATEVAPQTDGSYEVRKHYQMGRGSWEIVIFANDGRTAFFGDDGVYAGLFLFVGEKANDPMAGGTLYAAKWRQAPGDAARADIGWIRLGAATHAQIKALIDSGITIADIFEYSLAARPGFVPTRAGSAQTVWLRLKPGMAQAAAFLETRRYAAYLGASTEFTKGEGVAINHADRKLYYAISRIDGAMLTNDGGPADDVRLKQNKAGAIYTFELAAARLDTDRRAIASAYVPVRAYAEPKLLGRPIARDANGNTAALESIANPDNVFFAEKMRTLFIAEDSDMHQNNAVWAYNVDTKKLSRILSVAAGAEATGLQAIENLNGHAYLMSSNQHQGAWIGSTPARLRKRLDAKAIEMYGRNRHGTPNYRLEAQVGYIGGMPAFR